MDTIEGSSKNYLSSLNVFGVPQTDVSISSSQFIQISPVNALIDEGNINFRIPASLHAYYDLSSSFLYLKAKILLNDGKSIETTDKVAPSNFFFFTIFNNLRVTIQGTTVSDNGGFYPYRGILTHLLGTSEGEKKSSLTSLLYYPDTEHNSFDETKNEGFKKRNELSAKSESFDLIGRPSASIFEQNLFIVPGVEIDLCFTRSQPAFCLDSPVNARVGQSGMPWKVSIEQATLFVKSITVNQQIEKLHQNLFLKSNALYPLREFNVRGVTIPAGTQSFVTDAVFSSRVPGYLIVALLDSDAYQGNVKKSCQNFSADSLISITVKDDDSNIIYNHLDFDYSKKIYQQAFHSTFGAFPINSSSNGLSRDNFIKGNSVYLFDLSNSGPLFAFQPEKRGSVKVALKFNHPITHPLQLLVCGTLNNILSINKDRVATVTTK